MVGAVAEVGSDYPYNNVTFGEVWDQCIDGDCTQLLGQAQLYSYGMHCSFLITSCHQSGPKRQNSCLIVEIICIVQLIKYETAPNFIQLNQNLTSD